MKRNNPLCQYNDPDDFLCKGEANESGFCYWHDKSIDKTGSEVRGKLELYAKDGGLLRGIYIEKSNLHNIDLVNRQSKKGYDFSYAKLYHCDLSNAHLFKINFSHTCLMKANLSDAHLNYAQLENANLLGVKWQSSKIEKVHYGKFLLQELAAKKSDKEKDIELANDHYQQAEEIYRDLRKHAEHEGIFSLSGRFIQKELTMRRMQLPRYSNKRFYSKMTDLFCGYGEAPVRIVGISMGLILFCALLYSFTGLSYQGEVQAVSASLSISENLNIFYSSLYFSVVTFTTLGYGDFTPVGVSRALAAIEAFTGSFTIALFVVVFVKKMTR